jgi:hypothetical protein
VFGDLARMITVFHILPGMGLLFGTLGGFALGSRLGTIPGIICGALGGGVGMVCGRLPFILVLKSMKRDFRGVPTDRLRAMLRDPGFLAPNVLLLELGSRGEDIEREMPVVLDMLTAPSRERRVRGWHALESAFPARARIVGDYRIDDTPDQCRKKIQRLMFAERGAAPNERQ